MSRPIEIKSIIFLISIVVILALISFGLIGYQLGKESGNSDSISVLVPYPTESPTVTISPSDINTTIVPSSTTKPSPTSIAVSPTIINYPAGLSLSPATYKVGSNTEFKVTILAQAPYNAVGEITSYQLRLKIKGGTIVENSFVNPTGNLLTLATCPGGTATTINEVCVDIATTSGSIENNQNLGSFTIKSQTTNSILVSTKNDNAYIINGVEKMTGIVNLADYTVAL